MSAESGANHRQILEEAIENLYAVFAAYVLHGPVDGCPPLAPVEEDRLQSVPMRQLSGHDLATFAFRTLTTVGTLDDFKHFLPRLLEVVADHGSLGYTTPEVVLGKLRYGEWALRPQVEQQAVDRYLWALWRSILETFPGKIDVDSVLCGIGCAVDSLTPFLEAWLNEMRPSAISRLSEFMEANLTKLAKKHRLTNAFWTESEQQMMQVIGWLAAPSTSQRLEQLFFEHANEPVEVQLSQLVEDVGIIRRVVESMVQR